MTDIRRTRILPSHGKLFLFGPYNRTRAKRARKLQPLLNVGQCFAISSYPHSMGIPFQSDCDLYHTDPRNKNNAISSYPLQFRAYEVDVCVLAQSECMGAYKNKVEDGRQQSASVLLLPPPRREPFSSRVRTGPPKLIHPHKRGVMSQDVVFRGGCKPHNLGPGPAYASNSRKEVRMSPSANLRARLVTDVPLTPIAFKRLCTAHQVTTAPPHAASPVSSARRHARAIPPSAARRITRQSRLALSTCGSPLSRLLLSRKHRLTIPDEPPMGIAAHRRRPARDHVHVSPSPLPRTQIMRGAHSARRHLGAHGYKARRKKSGLLHPPSRLLQWLQLLPTQTLPPTAPRPRPAPSRPRRPRPPTSPSSSSTRSTPRTSAMRTIATTSTRSTRYAPSLYSVWRSPA